MVDLGDGRQALRMVTVAENGMRIKSFVRSGPAITLSWDSLPGATYKISGSLDLQSFPFTLSSSIGSGGTEMIATVDIPAGMAAPRW